MRIRRTRQETRFHSREVFRQPEPERKSPSELLTPEIREGLLQIKRGYEGGMIGDRMPPYTSFLAAARRCWPEMKDELQIANRFSHGISTEVTGNLQLLAREDIATWEVPYAESLAYVYKMAFINPALLRTEVEKNQTTLLNLFDRELQGNRYAYLLQLASILWLGAPGIQGQIAERLGPKSAEIVPFVEQSKAWLIGGLLKLFLPDVSINMPGEEQQKITRENEHELIRLAHVPNYGETGELDRRLNTIFSVGVLLADEAKLQPDGTIQYTYSKKPEQPPILPERSIL